MGLGAGVAEPRAEIAETTCAPTGWRQEPLRLIIRRVRIPVEELSEDARSRRRRTVPRAQLELALWGRVEYVYAYSFILTDLEGDAAEIEHWHRQRAQIEERVKEAELGRRWLLAVPGRVLHSGRETGARYARLHRPNPANCDRRGNTKH